MGQASAAAVAPSFVLVAPRAVNASASKPELPADSAAMAGAPTSLGGTLKLWIVDVGQGDGIIMKLPNGGFVVVDANEDGADAITFKGRGFEETVKKRDLLDESCRYCKHRNPAVCDIMIGASVEENKEGDEFITVTEFEAKSAEERWEYFTRQSEKCIRCYACRNACPLCYCDGCILDKLRPQWVKRSVDTAENFMFHLTRAFHLAGRCVSCGECERVCPASIPLMKLNRKMEKDVKELFNFEAGKDPAAQPLLNTFKIEDPDDFVL